MAIQLSEADVIHGSVHNMILAQSRDSATAARDMPSLMASMLRGDGWRVLVRPKDGRRFEHRTIQDWVLAPAWPGLHWPNWETLYAVLRTNTKDGPEVIRLLIEAGAPKPKDVDRELLVKKAEADGEAIGQGTRTDLSEHRVLNTKLDRETTNTPHLLRRLAREAPDVLDAYKRGEHKSARAAAIAAGLKVQDMVDLSGRPGTVAARIVARGRDYAEKVLKELTVRLSARD